MEIVQVFTFIMMFNSIKTKKKKKKKSSKNKFIFRDFALANRSSSDRVGQKFLKSEKKKKNLFNLSLEMS